MKRLVYILVAVLSMSAMAATVTDHYIFSMILQVPRIYNNTQSLGYRRYQLQRVTGEMTIAYDTTSAERPVVAIPSLTNRSHKISGTNITYACTIDEFQVVPRVNLVGSNATSTFKTPSVVFYLNADPSYALESGEDNALLVTLAGKGSCVTKSGVQRINFIQGRVAGTLGCGCKAYGHTSPTRVSGSDGPTDVVDDVASVYGSWSAKWKGRTVDCGL